MIKTIGLVIACTIMAIVNQTISYNASKEYSTNKKQYKPTGILKLLSGGTFLLVFFISLSFVSSGYEIKIGSYIGIMIFNLILLYLFLFYMRSSIILLENTIIIQGLFKTKVVLISDITKIEINEIQGNKIMLLTLQNKKKIAINGFYDGALELHNKIQNEYNKLNKNILV